MRGLIISLVGHIGVVIIMAANFAIAVPAPAGNSSVTVPIEIVDVADESNVRALSEAPPMEELQAAEEQQLAAVAETPTPTPVPSRRQAEDDFDLDAISGLIDRQDRQARQTNDGQQADRTQRGTGLGTAERVRIEDRITALTRAHLARCWRMPADLPNPDRLVVTVGFELDRNGNLRGQPRVVAPSNYSYDPAMRTAAEAALRAVRTCEPYPYPGDPVVGEHFDQWRSLSYRFIPPH